MLAKRPKEAGERFTPEQKAALRAKYQVQMAREISLKKIKPEEPKKQDQAASPAEPVSAKANAGGNDSAPAGTSANARRNAARWPTWLGAGLFFVSGAAILIWTSIEKTYGFSSITVWLGIGCVLIAGLFAWWGSSRIKQTTRS